MIELKGETWVIKDEMMEEFFHTIPLKKKKLSRGNFKLTPNTLRKDTFNDTVVVSNHPIIILGGSLKPSP